ncbi:MAG: hypothetical protein JSS76_15015 [Bacteroidetes bacterium]|nr:hypothetical protein [Bacteroidota bacterium]
MRRLVLFIFTIVLFVGNSHLAYGVPKPYLKFVFTTLPTSHFWPDSGIIIFSDDSFPRHCDTAEEGKLLIYNEKNGKYIYGSVLSSIKGRWLNEYALRLILYHDTTTVTSNTFRISNSRAEINVFISDKKVEAHEAFRSAHSDALWAIRFITAFTITRFIVLLAFYLRRGTTRRQYLQLLLACAGGGTVTLLALSGLVFKPLSLFVGISPIWFFTEALLFRNYTFPAASRSYIIASIALSFIASLVVSAFFSLFNI